VIPCYNAVRFVPDALESVFSQAYPDYEVLVVNDGSPETEELEALLVPYHPRIRYLRQENRGPAAARNTGIRQADGAYIAFLDSDDVWLPSFLSEQVRVLDSDPSLDMVYGGSILFGNAARSHGGVGARLSMPLEPTFENLVRRRCPVHPSCVVARKRALVEAGLFDEALTYSEDLDLWARLTHRGGRIGYRPQVLTRRRVHDQSLTVEVDRLILGQLEMSRKLLGTLPGLTTPQRAALEANSAHCEARLQLVYGTEHLLSRRFSEAFLSLKAANTILQSWKLRAALGGLRIAPWLVRRLWMSLLARHPTVEWFRTSRARRIESPTNEDDPVRAAEQVPIGESVQLGSTAE
jgi:cellulose synthase/poly-beta-1,6-N-acetylglucosamine synthase-like glycosyltransferase